MHTFKIKEYFTTIKHISSEYDIIYPGVYLEPQIWSIWYQNERDTRAELPSSCFIRFTPSYQKSQAQCIRRTYKNNA